MTPTIRTARVLLEPYVPADEETFVALTVDEAVNRYVGDGALSEPDARALFHPVFPAYKDNRFDVWAVHEDNEASQHTLAKIGFVHHRDLSNEDGHVTKVLVARRSGEAPLPPNADRHG